MAEEKKEEEKALAQYNNIGFSPIELNQIKEYREQGLPGISEVDDKKFLAAYDMRLSGRSWSVIGRTLKVPKIILMHFGEKFDWHKHRLEYLDNYILTQSELQLEEKLHDLHFKFKMAHAYRSYLEKEYNEYYRTGDKNILLNIDPDLIKHYRNASDDIKDLDPTRLPRNKEGKPAIGLNLGEGVTIKKLADNTVEITPKQKSNAEMLAEFIKAKQEEKKNQS